MMAEQDEILVLGASIVWRIPIRLVANSMYRYELVGGAEVIRDGCVIPIELEPPLKSDVWAEGDDLMWGVGPTLRIRPDGSKTTTEPPRELNREIRLGRIGGTWQPVDVRSMTALEGKHDPGCSAMVGAELWRLDGDFLIRGGVRVPLSMRMLPRVMAGGDGALFVRWSDRIIRIDGDGRCTTLASVGSGRSLAVDGACIVWVESDDSETLFMALPATGGTPRVVTRRPTQRALGLVSAYRGRALLRETALTEVTFGRAQVLMPQSFGFSVVDLPHFEVPPHG